MTQPPPWPPEALLPHAPPLLLLDRTLSCDDRHACAGLTIRPDLPGFGPAGIPSHWGLEYMAQTCGLWAGARFKSQGERVGVGYLLGTRRYHATRPYFLPGEQLRIEAELTYLDGAMGVFDCRVIGQDAQVAARAQLSVFHPDENKDHQP